MLYNVYSNKGLTAFHNELPLTSFDVDFNFFGLFFRLTMKKYRILYYLKEYNPLLDSSNMSMKDWAKIASDISDYYKLFDAFVILHGTDTMAYTASALSFMLEDLGKTVILTGSQVMLE